MPTTQKRRGAGSTLELDFGTDYQISAASFAPGPGGGIFSCSVSPMADETVAALDSAIRRRGPVRLLFPGHQAVLLDLVTLERKGPQLIRISGRVVAKGTESA
jgi:hypothetical protein